MTLQLLDTHQAPLAHATVTIASAPGATRDLAYRTDANGMCQLDVDQAGTYALVVVHDNLQQRVSQWLEPGSGTTTVTVDSRASERSEPDRMGAFPQETRDLERAAPTRGGADDDSSGGFGGV